MAFMIKEIIDLKGILILMLLTIPSQATTNLDCYGKAFHCVNSTHFMICVDLGTGVSTTIDDVIIPCPMPTVCKSTNRFECEFPTLSGALEASTIATTETTESEVTTFIPFVPNSIPFEEYFNTLSSTTLSESEPPSTTTDSVLTVEPSTALLDIINATKSEVVITDESILNDSSANLETTADISLGSSVKATDANSSNVNNNSSEPPPATTDSIMTVEPTTVVELNNIIVTKSEIVITDESIIKDASANTEKTAGIIPGSSFNGNNAYNSNVKHDSSEPPSTTTDYILTVEPTTLVVLDKINAKKSETVIIDQSTDASDNLETTTDRGPASNVKARDPNSSNVKNNSSELLSTTTDSIFTFEPTTGIALNIINATISEIVITHESITKDASADMETTAGISPGSIVKVSNAYSSNFKHNSSEPPTTSEPSTTTDSVLTVEPTKVVVLDIINVTKSEIVITDESISRDASANLEKTADNSPTSNVRLSDASANMETTADSIHASHLRSSDANSSNFKHNSSEPPLITTDSILTVEPTTVVAINNMNVTKSEIVITDESIPKDKSALTEKTADISPGKSNLKASDANSNNVENNLTHVVIPANNNQGSSTAIDIIILDQVVTDSTLSSIKYHDLGNITSTAIAGVVTEQTKTTEKIYTKDIWESSESEIIAEHFSIAPDINMIVEPTMEVQDINASKLVNSVIIDGLTTLSEANANLEATTDTISDIFYTTKSSINNIIVSPYETTTPINEINQQLSTTVDQIYTSVPESSIFNTDSNYFKNLISTDIATTEIITTGVSNHQELSKSTATQSNLEHHDIYSSSEPDYVVTVAPSREVNVIIVNNNISENKVIDTTIGSTTASTTLDTQTNIFTNNSVNLNDLYNSNTKLNLDIISYEAVATEDNNNQELSNNNTIVQDAVAKSVLSTGYKEQVVKNVASFNIKSSTIAVTTEDLLSADIRSYENSTNDVNSTVATDFNTVTKVANTIFNNNLNAISNSSSNTLEWTTENNSRNFNVVTETENTIFNNNLEILTSASTALTDTLEFTTEIIITNPQSDEENIGYEINNLMENITDKMLVLNETVLSTNFEANTASTQTYRLTSNNQTKTSTISSPNFVQMNEFIENKPKSSLLEQSTTMKTADETVSAKNVNADSLNKISSRAEPQLESVSVFFNSPSLSSTAIDETDTGITDTITYQTKYTNTVPKNENNLLDKNSQPVITNIPSNAKQNKVTDSLQSGSLSLLKEHKIIPISSTENTEIQSQTHPISIDISTSLTTPEMKTSEALFSIPTTTEYIPNLTTVFYANINDETSTIQNGFLGKLTLSDTSYTTLDSSFDTNSLIKNGSNMLPNSNNDDHIIYDSITQHLISSVPSTASINEKNVDSLNDTTITMTESNVMLTTDNINTPKLDTYHTVGTTVLPTPRNMEIDSYVETDDSIRQTNLKTSHSDTLKTSKKSLSMLAYNNNDRNTSEVPKFLSERPVVTTELNNNIMIQPSIATQLSENIQEVYTSKSHSEHSTTLSSTDTVVEAITRSMIKSIAFEDRFVQRVNAHGSNTYLTSTLNDALTEKPTTNVAFNLDLTQTINKNIATTDSMKYRNAPIESLDKTILPTNDDLQSASKIAVTTSTDNSILKENSVNETAPQVSETGSDLDQESNPLESTNLSINSSNSGAKYQKSVASTTHTDLNMQSHTAKNKNLGATALSELSISTNKSAISNKLHIDINTQSKIHILGDKNSRTNASNSVPVIENILVENKLNNVSHQEPLSLSSTKNSNKSNIYTDLNTESFISGDKTVTKPIPINNEISIAELSIVTSNFNTERNNLPTATITSNKGDILLDVTTSENGRIGEYSVISAVSPNSTEPVTAIPFANFDLIEQNKYNLSSQANNILTSANLNIGSKFVTKSPESELSQTNAVTEENFEKSSNYYIQSNDTIENTSLLLDYTPIKLLDENEKQITKNSPTEKISVKSQEIEGSNSTVTKQFVVNGVTVPIDLDNSLKKSDKTAFSDIIKFNVENTEKTHTNTVDSTTTVDQLCLGRTETSDSAIDRKPESLNLKDLNLGSEIATLDMSYQKSLKISDDIVGTVTDTMFPTESINKDFAKTTEDSRALRESMNTEIDVKSKTAVTSDARLQTEPRKKEVDTYVNSNKSVTGSIHISPEITSSSTVQKMSVKNITVNAEQVILKTTLAVSSPNYGIATEIITESDILVTDNMESEQTHSGIISSMTRPPTQRVSKENKEKPEKKESEVEEKLVKSIYADKKHAPIQAIDLSTPSNDISTIPSTINSNILQKDISGREEMMIKSDNNDFKSTNVINGQEYSSTIINSGKNTYNSTKSSESQYKKDIPTRDLIENSSVSNSHTSKDQNKSTPYAHNATVISNEESNTTRYMSQTKSTAAGDTHTDFPVLESTTHKTKSNKFCCKKKKRGRYADELDCSKFYICIGNNHVVEGKCPVNTVFSEIRKQCTKNLSHCIRNNQFQCVTEGRFSDFLNDNAYYICVKNNVNSFIRLKLLCQNGYHLNKTSIRCDLNKMLQQSTSTSDSSKNNSEQSVSSAKQEEKEKQVKRFKCKREGIFADLSDCRRYFECTKSDKTVYRQKRKKCDSDEIFHKDKKQCVDAESYECN